MCIILGLVSLVEMRAKQETVVKARETQMVTIKGAARLEEKDGDRKKRKKKKKGVVSKQDFWLLPVKLILIVFFYF